MNFNYRRTRSWSSSRDGHRQPPYNELIDLRTRVDERLREVRENGVPELRSRFADEAAALGLSLDKVFGAPKKRRGRPPADKPAE